MSGSPHAPEGTETAETASTEAPEVTSTEVPEAAVPETSSTDTDVTSPTSGEQDAEPATMLDAVTDALKDSIEVVEGDVDAQGDTSAPEPEAQPEPEKAEDPQPEKAATEDTDNENEPLSEDPTEQELAKFTPGIRRRVNRLIEQRNEARQSASQAEPIVKYMRDNDLPAQDVDVILQMASQLRHGKFAEFLESVSPFVNLAAQHTGQAIPEDLAKQVREGFVSEPVATELAQRRAQVQWQENRNKQLAQANEQQQVATNAAAIRDAVVAWEQEVRRTDLDYASKADIVRRTSQALVQEKGPPMTPQQAVEYARLAYEEANKWVTQFRPKPKPTAPSPSSVRQATTKPLAEPNSMLEAAEQALERLAS